MIPASLSLIVGTNTFAVALADNPAAANFAARLPLSVEMTDLHGNEKYAALDKPLPSKPVKVGRIETGDVMLFGDDCLVVFYKSFDTPWTYTRIGKVEAPAGLAAALGRGGVEATFKTENNPMQTFHSFTAKDNKGADVPLSRYAGKYVLVVNTATACGFTPQYDAIEALYAKYRDRGFEILDFPCNQFGAQAPGTDEQIHSFCTLRFHTEFPRFAKVDVNGPDAAPLFKWLVGNTRFEGFPPDGKIAPLLEKMLGEADPDYAKKPDIKWNFTKFLIGPDGEILRRFEPTAGVEPIDTMLGELLGETK